jgi:hypothetical protein
MVYLCRKKKYRKRKDTKRKWRKRRNRNSAVIDMETRSL